MPAMKSSCEKKNKLDYIHVSWIQFSPFFKVYVEDMFKSVSKEKALRKEPHTVSHSLMLCPCAVSS